MVIVLATLMGAAYVFRAFVRWSDSATRISASDLSGGEFDMRAFGCGSYRWAVKTLSDEDAARAVDGEPRHSTVEELSMMPPPHRSSHAPRFPEEVEYVLDGAILAYKTEADLDIHVIIGGDHGTIVAEFPNPDCVPRLAARPRLESARNQLLDILRTLPDSMLREPIPVRIRGVLFFDKHHGQTGESWNGAELHPALEITARYPR
jgi:hypothetical protein